jgi:N5-(cytidine 5'-diphosphoramidyl)-L-glutamine hydrolase
MVLRVAISQRVVDNASYVERRDALAHDWSKWASAMVPSAVLFPVPNKPDGLETWVECLNPDLIVLSGGNNLLDIPERDKTEWSLIDVASRKGLPVFGVCRGMQVLNAYFGGQVCTDIGATSGISHVAANHLVDINHPGFRELADTNPVIVNSFHDQGVLLEELAPELEAFAVADGGVVEGVVHKTRPVLAIQWHPERDNPARIFDTALLERFISQGSFWRGAG